MKVKVCGNTDLHQLQQLDELNVDYAGLIFYEQSPRFALNKLCGKEIKDLQLSLTKVGVFVNAGEDEIMKRVDEFGLDMVQLHGDETATFCNKISNQIKVIKAFRVADTDTNIDWLVNEYDEVCDYYLFDKGSAGLYGGTGQKFKWNLLKNATINKPFFLSGGIERSDAHALKKFVHPFFYGVDVNSRFEISPGIKNMELVTEFVSELESA
ncbi:MAG TPA: phosphoribosylanthranilate isomerase [Hanamia sp.]|jgi:phosphoribosylanthranilate isomerase|nr:phosphoribosylanthranilate isomerase [Hanamia sp.]HZI68943.1 phosphoribosylanthranilate isomerase [Hanamia sp.]